MSIPWIPTGELKDGTLLLGPLTKKPADTKRVVEISVSGRAYWILHSGPQLRADQMNELQQWAQARLAEQGPSLSR